MADLKAAWQRVLELVERGDGYERREEQDEDYDFQRVIYDWGEDRLQHILFEPLSEEGARRFEENTRKLPPALRELLTKHSNGVDLLSGDLVVFGVRTSPYSERAIGFVENESGQWAARFGWAGTDHETLYLDEDGGIRIGVHEDARWSSLGELLTSVLAEGLERCWDDDGKRVEDLRVAEPPPDLGDDVTLAVPKTHAKRLEALRSALGDKPRKIKAAGTRFPTVAADELGKLQLGFRVHPSGRDLTGRKKGDWLPTWVVIGTDEDVGDPLFVDVADDDLPVFTAMHGQGSWDPEEVADALADLLGRR